MRQLRQASLPHPGRNLVPSFLADNPLPRLRLLVEAAADEDTRVNISVDLLERLRDGLLYTKDYVEQSNTQNDLKTYRSPFARRR